MNRKHLAAFLAAFPDDFKDPELCLEGDGEYGVEWYGTQHNTLSVSVGPKGYTYAWINEHGGSGHGFLAAEKAEEMIEIVRVNAPWSVTTPAGGGS